MEKGGGVAAPRAVVGRQWRDRTGAELRALFDRPDVRPVGPGVQSVSRWWADGRADFAVQVFKPQQVLVPARGPLPVRQGGVQAAHLLVKVGQPGE